MAYDETGVEFLPKNERGYVPKGTKHVTFIGDRKNMCKRQFSTINAYRNCFPTPEENVSYARMVLGNRFNDLTPREVEAIKFPDQPFIAVIFPGNPLVKTRRGSGSYVDSRFPAGPTIRKAMRSWPTDHIKYYFSPRGKFFL